MGVYRVKHVPKIIKSEDQFYEATPRFGSKITSEQTLGEMNKTITFDTKVVT